MSAELPLVAVIDDDDSFRTSLVGSLCSFGCRVGGFASAEEFLAADLASSCDCIITDCISMKPVGEPDAGNRKVSSEPLLAVIDDDDSFRTALVESLCSFGYRARGFASAEEFLAADLRSSWDCIITDIHMPGMSGLDLKRQLSAHDSKVPVIMITARQEEGLEARVAASGAACLLRKPFSSDELIGWLKKLVNPKAP